MRSSVLRQVVAAVLLVVLTLSGVGRAVATVTAAVPLVASLAGINVPICHAGRGAPSSPAAPARHECCDECALCAAVSLPGGAPFVEPAEVEPVAAQVEALTEAPVVARVPTPRCSQGPPAT